MAFDKSSLDDYVEVNERVIEFYSKYEKGSLQADITHFSDAEYEFIEYDTTNKWGKKVHVREPRAVKPGMVVMRARAYRSPDDQLPGVGYSSMIIPGTTPYTKGSEIENCETSAWGRALAAIGIKVKRSIASKEEVENKKEADGGQEVEEKVEGGAEAPAEAEAGTTEISAESRNEMMGILIRAAGLWGANYISACLQTWGARPVEQIEHIGRDANVDFGIIQSLTENEEQRVKFHSRLKKLTAAVDKAAGVKA